MKTFALRHPLLFSLAVTIAFLILLILPTLAVSGKSDAVLEAVGAVQRIVIAAMAFAFATYLGWRDVAGLGTPGTARSWLLIVPPLVYLGIVYPLFFTGSIAPNLREPRLTAIVAANAFAAGAMEELIFRGLIFYALLQAWGRSQAMVVRAAVVSSLFFSVPHLTNIAFGQQPLRVTAQVGWAFLLGAAFALLVYAGGSIWPVAFAHGALDAVVATNRIGKKIELAPVKALLLVAASLPVLVYAWMISRRPPSSPRPPAAS